MAKYINCYKCNQDGETANACHCDEVSESTGTAGYNSLLADYRKLREAAKCVRHWHDTHNDGMIVSGSHVRELWKVLAETQEV